MAALLVLFMIDKLHFTDSHAALTWGACFVATGVSQYLGSVVANFAQMPAGNLDPLESLPLYTRLFNGLGWLAAGGAR